MVYLVKRVREKISHFPHPLKVAIMGCVVNGPGEAREADIGLAGGKGMGVIFQKGTIVKKCKEEDLFPVLIKMIEEMI